MCDGRAEHAITIDRWDYTYRRSGYKVRHYEAKCSCGWSAYPRCPREKWRAEQYAEQHLAEQDQQ